MILKVVQARQMRISGLSIANLNDEYRAKFQIPQNEKGILVYSKLKMAQKQVGLDLERDLIIKL